VAAVLLGAAWVGCNGAVAARAGAALVAAAAHDAGVPVFVVCESFKVADLLVSDVHITANKNTVPFDPQSPFVTSGLRLGTAACTTRGFDEAAFREVADVIADRLLNPEDSAIEQRCRDRVAALCERFPLYAAARELQHA
jgi:hypothetical protein